MKHTIKNIILSVISICCLVIAIHLFLGGVDNISANRASKCYIETIKDPDKVEYLY